MLVLKPLLYSDSPILRWLSTDGACWKLTGPIKSVYAIAPAVVLINGDDGRKEINMNAMGIQAMFRPVSLNYTFLW